MLEQFEIVPLGGSMGDGRVFMGLHLGDDAAKNLPEERVYETNGVRCHCSKFAFFRLFVSANSSGGGSLLDALHVCGGAPCCYFSIYACSCYVFCIADGTSRREALPGLRVRTGP